MSHYCALLPCFLFGFGGGCAPVALLLLLLLPPLPPRPPLPLPPLLPPPLPPPEVGELRDDDASSLRAFFDGRSSPELELEPELDCDPAPRWSSVAPVSGSLPPDSSPLGR